MSGIFLSRRLGIHLLALLPAFLAATPAMAQDDVALARSLKDQAAAKVAESAVTMRRFLPAYNRGDIAGACRYARTALGETQQAHDLSTRMSRLRLEPHNAEIARGLVSRSSKLLDSTTGLIRDFCSAPAASANPAAVNPYPGDNQNGRDSSRPQAGSALEVACANRDAVSCTELGVNFTDGVNVIKDERRGAGLFQKACQLKNARGCMLWGYALENGRGTAVNLSEAFINYEFACAGGNALGCNNLGVLHQYGKGTPRNELVASVLYSRACQMEAGVGCRNLGILRADALTLPQDRSLAVAAFEKGCSYGDMDSCNKQAWHAQQGLGTALNIELARRLYAKACNGGNALACENGRILAAARPAAASVAAGAAPSASTAAADGYSVCSAFMSEGRKVFLAGPFAAAASRSKELALAYAQMLRENRYAAASPYAPAGSPPPALTVDCRWHATTAAASEFKDKLVGGSTRDRMTTVPTTFNPQ